LNCPACGCYGLREHKIAVVMSCGKNFAVWKTAGREIPWQTPDAPNNIIHVRLATGSVVEQMNAHPFARLHTALTHNGETTNYEALKQRVEQFSGWDKISPPLSDHYHNRDLRRSIPHLIFITYYTLIVRI